MHLFVYEFICGGGLAGQPLPESLALEGWTMLRSIVEDFSRVSGCSVTTLLDKRLLDRWQPLRGVAVEVARDEREQIHSWASRCDGTLIIAPEFDRILMDRTQRVENSGGRLLGSTAAAIEIASDKLACNALLRDRGVPAVTGQLISTESRPIPTSVRYPAVIKPRDGAGSQANFLVTDSQSAYGVLDAARGLIGPAALVEPFVPGIAASVSFLVNDQNAFALLAGEQLLSSDGRFRYLGGRLPLSPVLAMRATELARRAVTSISGLRGFVGVDIVLGDAHSRSTCDEVDVVIEVNPRLTTSYVGLRSLSEMNLAEQWLNLMDGRVPQLAWKAEQVCFRPDGSLESRPSPTLEG